MSVAVVSKCYEAGCPTPMCFAAEVGENSGPPFGISEEKTDFHTCLSHDVSPDTTDCECIDESTECGATETVLSVHTCGCMSSDVPAASDEV